MNRQVFCAICVEEPDWRTRWFGTSTAIGDTLVTNFCWRHQKRARQLEQDFLAKGQPFQGLKFNGFGQNQSHHDNGCNHQNDNQPDGVAHGMDQKEKGSSNNDGNDQTQTAE